MNEIHVPTDIGASLHRLGWKPVELSRMLGVPVRTVHAWLSTGLHGREPHPAAVMLLELAEDLPSVRRRLEARGRR